MASYFIDPNSGTDDTAAGRGDSAGDPWQTVQFALNNTTAVAAGDQFNIKAGTADTLAASLSLATYGTPDYNSPLIFRGYTTAENDGGVGDIDGDAKYAIIAGTPQNTHFIDMRLHNTGANAILSPGLYSSVQRCEVDTTTGSAIVLTGYCTVNNCNIHDYDLYGINLTSYAKAAGNYFSGVDTGSTAIYLNGNTCSAIANIMSLTGGAVGVDLNHNALTVLGNSILSSSGTGKGIYVSGSAALSATIANNVVDGFIGVGGIGIDVPAGWGTPILAFNAVYNCSTKYTAATKVIWSEDNEELSATSPFAKSGSDTFANRFTYFAPVDTGNVRGGAFPDGCRRDKGAVQHADPSSSVFIMPSRPNSLLRR